MARRPRLNFDRNQEVLINAVTKAASQDTLGGFLNALPNYLLEQEQYRNQQQKEAERYNDQVTFRNQQYQDNLDRQKRADEIFRDICIEVNGFYSMNYLAYWSLRLGGWVAWNGHRKRNAKIK